MVGTEREPRKETKPLNRPDKSPIRSQTSNDRYRDRSRDRSAARVNTMINGASVPDSDKKRNLKSVDKVDQRESIEDDHSSGSEERRGRSATRPVTGQGDDEDVDIDDKNASQSIADMNSQEMMMKMMGFGSFDSTKGKHVEGVGSGVAKKNKSTKYRQYMNREKGFNRALSPGRK